MDECLQMLAQKQECPTDEILVQQVKLQLIMEKVGQTPWYDKDIEHAEFGRAPRAFYLMALQSQLQEVRRKIPSELQRDEIVLLHVYSTEVTIHENALTKAPIISNNSDFQRLDNLHACLDSIKAWFGVFFKIPVASYLSLPFSIFSQLAHCLIDLYKLSTLDDLSWDKNVVRNTANVLLILDQIVNNVERVNVLAGMDQNNTETDLFTIAGKMFRSVRLRWGANLGVQPSEPAIPTAQNVDETMTEAFSMDLYDDVWLTDLFAS